MSLPSLFAFLLGIAFQVQAPLVPAQSVKPSEAKQVVKETAPKGDHEGKALVLPALPHGVYILRIPENGTATVEQVAEVQVVGPTPPTPPPPTPTDLTERAVAIGREAIKVGDPATAKNLAEVFRQVAKLGRDGTVKDPATLQAMTKYATDTLLGPVKAPSWQKTRDVLAIQWSQIPAGSSINEYCKLLEEASTGLDAVDPKKSISPETLKWILEVLLPLLLKIFGL